MTVIAPPQRGTAEAIAARIPLWGQIQKLVYSAVCGQWAVGFWSGLYVLVFQAHYFGKSFKYTWDHLAQLWHVRAIPGAGPWMYLNSDLFRHLYLRDAPESILAYAVVAMIVPVLASKKKAKPPLIHRIMVRLGMPSPYQGDLGRHPDTSGLQYLFLMPSMLLAAIPGEIIMSVLVFGGMAAAHRAGYHSPWLTPTSPWVSVAIGIGGGRLAGHAPAVKAGQDIQRFYASKRVALVYAADKILSQFKTGQISQDKARHELTSMRRSDPSILYPASYRMLYDRMVEDRVPVREYGRVSTIVTVSAVIVFVVVGGWGIYLRKWGITHGFWMPW